MSGGEGAEMRCILLATDFGQWSTGAVDKALSMARRYGAELFMVHGIEALAKEAIDDDEEDGNFDEFFEELVKNSQDQLEALVARAEEAGVSARFHIEIGQRWRIILEQARIEEVDLIILGRRAYQEQDNLALGTTSQRVYFSSDRPVLIVPDERTDEDGER